MSEVLLTSSDTEEEDADEEYEEEASEEIPASLLSYFEASRRRAAACEKLILEDLEYLTASQCNERPAQANFALVDKDTKTTNETADTSDEQNEDSSASSGSYADEQEFSTVPCDRHDVVGSELQLDMERRRREEQDFEKELQRMMAAGKLRQKEADMTEVKAREELEREFRLQQELLNDMKRQLEEEVKKKDEEQRRLARRQKEEEEKRKRGQDEDRWKMVQGKLKEEEEKNEKSKEANRKQRMEEEERRKETQSKLKEEVEMTRSTEEDDKRRKHVEEEQEMKVKREEVEARRKQTEEEEKRRTDEDGEGRKQPQEEPAVNKEERRFVEKEESTGEEATGRATEDDEKKKRGEPMNERNQNTEEKEKRNKEEASSKRTNEEYDQWRCEKENQRTEEVEKRKSHDTGMRKVKEKMEVKERMGEDEKLLEEEKSEEQRMKRKDEKMTGRRQGEERRNTKKSDESTDDENEEPLTKNQRQRDASNPNLHRSITENIHENIHHNSSCQSCLSRLMDQRRLSWMEVRVPWSEMENRSRRTSSFASRRESRRCGQDHDLPPLCPDALLGAAGRSSLQEVTILVLEDLPGCSLSTLAQCTRLQSLTMRRCGLRVLEGIGRLADLCYVDVPENQISRLDCEDMTGLRVLKMSCNKLTSIHGLSGAENLHILELSHNSIARIAGLDSLRRLQRLSLDHNQLVSTKGLKDVCTLLHLDCSYNHLARVEGLESNVLLRTLDLTSNSLSEPPALQDHVLLGELHMDDNSLASLRHLFSASWLPQLHTLTLAHNRLTHLPDMSVAVSLANLDLRFNCLSDVQDVCRSLEGCCSLDEVHLAGNPLQRESGWRCTLQAEVSSLRTIDGTDADILRTHSAVARQIDSGSDVLSLIRTQVHQMNDLQRQHAEQLSKASRPLDAIKLSCGHLMEALHLAKEQRRSLERAHVGPTSASWTTLEDSLDEVSPVASGTGSATPFCDVHASAVEGTKSSVQMVSHHQDWDLQSNSVASEVGGRYASYEGNPESAVQKNVIAQHHAATLIQARWRGFTLRRRLAAALAAVTSLEDDDDAFEWVDVEEFVLDETTLEQGWTLCEDAPARCYSASKQPLPGIYPEHSQLVLPPLPKQRLTQAWEVKECDEKRVSPRSSNRKMSSSTSMASDFSERSERILEEWGFTNRHTAELMLRRAQKMKSKQKSAGPSGQLEAWRNQPLTTYQLERPNRLARRNRNATRVHQPETGPGRARWDRTREWLRNQNTLRHSESEHFLPNISADLVSGGRRHLLAPEAGHMENQATGVWACNNLLAQDCRENKNAVGLPVESEQDIPTAWRKERISFRNEPVCRSSGWGGGKKRQKVKH